MGLVVSFFSFLGVELSMSVCVSMRVRNSTLFSEPLIQQDKCREKFKSLLGYCGVFPWHFRGWKWVRPVERQFNKFWQSLMPFLAFWGLSLEEWWRWNSPYFESLWSLCWVFCGLNQLDKYGTGSESASYSSCELILFGSGSQFRFGGYPSLDPLKSPYIHI